MNRRKFLASAGVAALGMAGSELHGLAQQTPAPPTNLRLAGGTDPIPGENKAVISAQDLVWQGAFRLPAQDASWGVGFTHRRVGADLRFLSTQYSHLLTPSQNPLFEATYPGVSKSAPYPLSQTVKTWGDIFQGWRRGGDNLQQSNYYGQLYGLHWDEVDGRLYWTYGNGYNTQYGGDATMGATELPSTGNPRAIGAWRFANRSVKMTFGGVTPIPRWFADAYANGHRLGIGFGGYLSIVAFGPASMGPALTAFAPPSNLSQYPALSQLPNVPLVGYPYNTNRYTNPMRCERDPDIINQFDDWAPKDGVGYWSWCDTLWQGGCWVDTPTKHGLLFFPTFGNGRNWYETSDRHAERGSHALFVYDPADLGKVARGNVQQHAIKPRRYPWQFAGITYPLERFQGDPGRLISGVTWDAVTQQLFVAVRFGWQQDPSNWGHLVNVYKVA